MANESKKIHPVKQQNTTDTPDRCVPEMRWKKGEEKRELEEDRQGMRTRERERERKLTMMTRKCKERLRIYFQKGLH